jgi:hypothetical protein
MEEGQYNKVDFQSQSTEHSEREMPVASALANLEIEEKPSV